MKPTLVTIAYSPWSRRAKHALDAMGVDYALRAYVPTLSEPRLRLDLRRPFGKVTLPVLLRADGPPICDSLDIVRWAAARSDRPVITPANEAEVVRWSAMSDRLMEAGRIRTARRVLADPAAQTASLPAPLRPLGPAGRLLARDAARRLLRKYGEDSSDDALLAAMRAVLDEARATLDGRETLLDRPSYADHCLAWALVFVRPHERQRIAPAAARCWTEPELAERYADLLAWRDRVLAS